ncbi:hypothetical protein OROHE_007229 [Orobanche hederae]
MRKSTVQQQRYKSTRQDKSILAVASQQFYEDIVDHISVKQSINTNIINNTFYLDNGDADFTCEFCEAIMWYDECIYKSKQLERPAFSMYCAQGKVQLPLLKTPPPLTLKRLLLCEDPRSMKFLDNIRAYNSMFSFTFMGEKWTSINKGNAPYVFKLKGTNYHRIGSLLPTSWNSPKFSQLYIYDIEHEVDNRINVMSNRSKPSRNSLDVSIINDPKNMLDDNNSLVKSFRMVRERFQSDSDIRRRLKLIGEREFDGRIYNLPTVGEVAALIVGDFDESFNQRDVIVETRTGLLKRISELHPSYLSLQYPLSFPYGEDGYRVGIQHSDASSVRCTKRNKLTIREFFAFRI